MIIMVRLNTWFGKPASTEDPCKDWKFSRWDGYIAGYGSKYVKIIPDQPSLLSLHRLYHYSYKFNPWCLPLAEILRVQPKKIASRYLGYLPPHIYPSSCFLYFGVVSDFFSPDTFTIKYKSSTRSWLSVPRNFIQEGFWYMKQFKQGFWTFCLEGIVRDRFPNPQGSC